MAKGMDVVEKSLEDLEKEITCTICYNHYTEPKVLPCLHYYCKQCVLKLALRTGMDKPFSCPECRKEATLPEGNEDNLPTAFSVNRLKSVFATLERAHGKVEVKCEVCSDSGAKAEGFCRQCAMFICEKCVESHKRMKKVFEGHKIASFQDLIEGKAKDMIMKEPPTEKCPIHKQPLIVYCFDCNGLICHHCTAKDHRDHVFEFSTVAAPETKEKLMEELKPLQEVQVNLSHVVEEVRTTKHEVESQGKSVANNIETCFEELHQILDRHKQEMLEEIGRKVREKTAKLSKQEENLSIASAEVQSVINFAKQCVGHCTNNEVMSMHANIRSHIKQEIQEHSKLLRNMEAVEEADIRVDIECAEALQKLCKTKAKITLFPVNSIIGGIAGEVEVNLVSEIRLTTTKLSNNEPTKCNVVIDCQLKSLYNGSSVNCNIDRIGAGDYRIQYTPTVRGRHELMLSVNECQVAGSPFPVFVVISPTQLRNPVSVWDGIDRPTGIAVNSVGELIVTEYEGDIVVLNKEGEKVRSIENSKHNCQKLCCISVDCEDNIYFMNAMTNTIFKSNKKCSVVHEKKVKQVNGPGYLGLAVVGDEVMVCEKNNKGTIMVYDRELNYVRRIAHKDMGTFFDLSPDSHGNLYSIDRDNSCIRVFSNEGDFLRSFGCDGNGVEKLKWPRSVCVAGQYVYVTDHHDDNVSVFTTEGKYVTSIGQRGSKENDFNCPRGVCVDEDGFVYVCDIGNNRIKVL